MRLGYDSDQAVDIPPSADAPDVVVAGYVGGVHPWSPHDWGLFPRARHVRISRSPLIVEGVDCLDVEGSLASPGQAATWLGLRYKLGLPGMLYTNLDNWAIVRHTLRLSRLAEPTWWIAHFVRAKFDDVTIPDGAVGIQFANEALSGGHFDLSKWADHIPGIDPERIEIQGDDDMISDRDIRRIFTAEVPADPSVQPPDHQTEFWQILRDTLDRTGKIGRAVADLTERVNVLAAKQDELMARLSTGTPSTDAASTDAASTDAAAARGEGQS